MLGFEPGALLPEADVVLVVDSAVPWIPKAVTLRPGAKVIHSPPTRWCRAIRSAPSRPIA